MSGICGPSCNPYDTEAWQREPGCTCEDGYDNSACPNHGTDTIEPECPFHSAGNTGRCNYCEDQ